MKNFKKVMVAIAFSENAVELFKFAADFASNINADLVAANIINSRDVDAVAKIASMGYEVSGDSYVRGLEEERRGLLDEMLEKSKFPKNRFRAIFRVGTPEEELLKVAIEEQVDLMIIGIKAHMEWEHFLVGSVAEKLFRRSPINIVSFRDEKSQQRLKKHLHVTGL